jgi:dipeptidyl aminopeptidase/acylaminoacyl peptidase
VLKTVLAASAAALLAIASPVAAADKSDLAIYGALPNIEAVEISPDGSKLAVVTTDGKQRFLTVRKTEGGALAGLALGKAKLRNLRWAGEKDIAFVTSEAVRGAGTVGPAREYFQAVDFDLVGRKQKPLLHGEKDTMNIVVQPPHVRVVDGDPIAFLEGIYFMRGQGADTLFRTNLKTGTLRRLDIGARYGTDAWLVDAAGEPLAQTTYDGKTGRWSLLMRSDNTFKTVGEVEAPTGSFGLSGLGRDGKSALVWRTGDNGENTLREYAVSGASRDVPGGPYAGVVHDPASLALIGGYRLDGDAVSYTFFDPAAQSAWNKVSAPFRPDRVFLHAWSNDRRKVVVRVESATEGPAYALVDLDTKRGGYLGAVYKGVTPRTISPVKAISYKAADGLEISGYLTLPRCKEARNLPLIVVPHADPQGRDTLDFDWLSQALASRGYAVLRPNYRGSEGFGAAFVKAGFGEWGRKMQTDLSDGVRDLARQGVVDPKRVCIMGQAYGGYAALAGAVLDKGVYRCAVSIAGLSDLIQVRQSILNPEQICGRSSTFVAAGARGSYECSTAIAALPDSGRILAANIDEHQRQTTPRGWLRYMGPDLAALSPVRLADRIDIPVLLIHGKDDTVAPFAQSQAMADALTKAGKSVRLVALENEDHWLTHGETRLQALTEAVAFLEKNNPPD